MVIYKQRMKLSAGDVAFISLASVIAFMVGWYLFGLFIAIILALLVVAVGFIRMKRTRSVDRLNSEKELFQETLFKK